MSSYRTRQNESIENGRTAMMLVNAGDVTTMVVGITAELPRLAQE
jgi:hypothetical protein